ncbi:MAG: non-ribosomal peptide synthetase, partial [Rhodanobacter sp.]
ADLPAVHRLPLDRPRPARQRFEGGRIGQRIGRTTLAAAKALATAEGASLFMLLQTAFAVLLSRYSGETDIVMGTPVAGRVHRDVEPLVGFFVNTLVLRHDLSGLPDAREALARTRDLSLAAFAAQDVPFDMIVDDLRPERSLAHGPLVQIMLTMHDEVSATMRLPDATVTRLEHAGQRAQFELELFAREGSEGLELTWVHATSVFDESTVRGLCASFELLLKGMTADPSSPVMRLPLRDTTGVPLSSFGEVVPQPGVVHVAHAFERSAQQHADEVALVDEAGELGYGELNAWANRVAHALLSAGVKADDRVAVLAGRGRATIAGVLGILKAGAAYLPVDPAWPAARQAWVLEDAAPVWALATADATWASEPPVPLLAIDAAALSAQPTHNPSDTVRAHGGGDLAYVIYTSGSTGQPKGVMVEHRQVLDLWATLDREVYAACGARARVSLNAGLSFDASVQSLTQLLSGRALVLVPAAVRADAAAMLAFLRRQRIDVLDITPAQVELLLAQGLPRSGEGCPRAMLVGGEAIPARTWSALAGLESRVANVYGPTECTVDTTLAWIAPGEEVPHLGRPMANSRVYVLDAHGAPVPVGVRGELYVGGAGVARGYLHRDALTAERFLADPFAGEADARMYRTGDLGRWRADGTLEYLGRNDSQVKIRGHRIEPGEVEAAVQACPGVRDAVVAVREDVAGEARLVAYVVGTADGLREHLAGQLPAYMLPSAIVPLDALPLTANGKLDRRALPAPVYESTAAFEAPLAGTEQALASLWSELLGVTPVGAHDDFFRLGGHSLLAMRVAAAVAQRLGKEVAVRALFEHPTLRALAAHVDAQAARGHAAIPVADRDGPLPLSFAQQRLWFIDRLEGGSAQYNMPAGFRIRGRLDEVRLQVALDALVARHEVLRTTYAEQAGEPVQVIHARASVALARHDLRALAPAVREEVFASLAVEEAGAPFDLGGEIPLRGRLVALADDEYALLLTLHHIAADGWSLEVLVGDFMAAYAGQLPLPALPLQYADYAAWQRERLQGETRDTQLAYWRTQLADLPAVHRLPLDRPRPARQRFEGGRIGQRIGRTTLAAAKALAAAEGTSLFMLLQTAFAVLLSRYSGETDIVMGTPVAGRVHRDVEPLVGFFLNTLVLRSDLSASPTFREALARGKAMALDAFAHQELPLETLVDELAPMRSLAHAPLFQVSFTLQNQRASTLELPGLSLKTMDDAPRSAQFDLQLLAEERDGHLSLDWVYATSLFEEGTIERLSRAFACLLEAAVASPSTPVERLPVVDALDRATLAAWNATARPYPSSTTLHGRFAEVAAACPEAVAVVEGAARIDYATLEAQANRVAHYLREQGVGPDQVVALCAERSIAMVVGMLGILKAGGAYLPLDPAFPEERVAYLLEDAGVSQVLATRDALEALPRLGERQVLPLDAELREAFLAGYPAEAPAGPAGSSRDLAYVMYTSGSTGQPKGVMVEHRNVLRLAVNAGFAPLGADDCVAHAANPAFDAATWELWAPLLAGARVLVVPAATVLEPAAFGRLLVEGGVSALWLTVGLFNEMAEALAEAFGRLRYLLVGGDALDPASVARALSRPGRPGCLINGYGPTETTTFAATHAVASVPAGARSIPIGRPIGNTRIHVLDATGQPVPVGVAGELYIAGDGVARGYLNQPELTAERFVADPFAGEAEARMYRSGDLGRWLADGTLEYLGRNDGQVKIRGFRIELDEVQAVLSAQPGVHRSVVVVRREAGEARLVAYVVGEAPLAAVREGVERVLPAYMRPAAWVSLAALPLTANGKVDRAALPVPEVSAQVAYAAPSTATEQALATIWARVLRQERVGAQDNFFDLGGHSLLATRVVSEIAGELQRKVPVRALFEHPTLAALAAWVDAQATSVHAPIPVVGRDGRLPLSYAQQRLWFIDRLEGGSRQYNMPAALRLRGALDGDALQRALDTLLARHEVLRTTFAEVDGEPVQMIRPAGPLLLQRQDLRDLPPDDRDAVAAAIALEEAATPFDLANDVMVRCRLLTLDSLEHVLLVTMHHIASDGWSIDVFVRELSLGYSAPEDLPPTRLQYADYAAWQRGRIASGNLRASLDYWRTQLAGLPAVHRLPLDQPRSTYQTFESGRISRRLDGAKLGAMHALARRHDASLSMVVQTAFAVVLARFSGEDDVVVGMPVAGRLHKDIEPLIGFFVNTLVMRTDLSGEPSFGELLGRVRETALAAYEHQEVPFDMLVDELRPPRSLAYSPLFQISLMVQNNARPVLELTGIDVEDMPLEEIGQAKFDLQLYVNESIDGLTFGWSYATALFDPATIERMAAGLERVLHAAIASDTVSVHAIDLVSEEDLALLAAWNDTALSLPVDRCVHEWFEQRCAETPDAVALRCGAATLTYARLNERANRIAHRLIDSGVGADDRVAILANRDASLVAAMLGVLKAGAAYLPLDAAYPDERLRYMLEDGAPRVALIADTYRHRVEGDVAVLALDATDGDDAWPSHNPERRPGHDSSNLAYIIYTSGSTGRPKGVAIEHRNASNLIAWALHAMSDAEMSATSFVTSVNFDLSVFELFVPLARGAMVVLEADALALDADSPVTLMNTVPSAAMALATSDRLPRSARTACLAGEPLPRSLVERLFRQSTLDTVINLYGPSETTTYSTVLRMPRASGFVEGIGRPVANTQVHILDARGARVPVGVRGEICIGGCGVARGYLGRHDLTAERFVPDPFAGVAGARMYRTGDEGRWLPDGTLEYLGRNDFQVKIRGFRIEPGEIEAVLSSCAGVREVIVAPRDSATGERVLVAYVVGASDVGCLRDAVAARLPAFMMPSAFVLLDALPLTANGKVDRKALPAPEAVAFDAAAYVPPDGPVEERLAALWAEVLGQQPIGAEDDFFGRGGHSLLAVQLAARVRREFGTEATLRDLFEYPVLRAFARHLVKAGESAEAGIARVDRSVPLPMSYGQQRLWFIDRLEGGSAAYHMPAAIELRGGLDTDALRSALQGVIERHEVLRTVYADIDGEPRQIVKPAGTLVLGSEDLAHLGAEARAKRLGELSEATASEPFDLSSDDAMRCRLVRLSDEEHVLLVTLHHIAADGWSIGLLVDEVAALYAAYREGRADPLPPLALQYGDVAAWQRGPAQAAVQAAGLAYWRDRLADAPLVHDLPLDRPRPARQG